MKRKEIDSLKGDKLRQCITDPEAPDVYITLSEKSKEICKKHRDRDAFGSVGICQKGIYTLLRKIIPFYEHNYLAMNA